MLYYIELFIVICVLISISGVILRFLGHGISIVLTIALWVLGLWFVAQFFGLPWFW